jgi:hypothetical protein
MAKGGRGRPSHIVGAGVPARGSVPEGRLDNRPALQLQRRPIIGAPLRGAAGSVEIFLN